MLHSLYTKAKKVKPHFTMDSCIEYHTMGYVCSLKFFLFMAIKGDFNLCATNFCVLPTPNYKSKIQLTFNPAKISHYMYSSTMNENKFTPFLGNIKFLFCRIISKFIFVKPQIIIRTFSN